MKLSHTELETENLRLTRPYITDAEAMYEALSDGAVFRYNTWKRHENALETLAFVNNLVIRYENGDAEWVIREKDKDRALGIICLREYEKEENCAEIGLWLASPFHNRGYGGEAAEKIIRFGFEVCKAEKIVAFCHPENEASLRIFKKNGFSVESEEENTFSGEDFIYTPVILKLSAFN